VLNKSPLLLIYVKDHHSSRISTTGRADWEDKGNSKEGGLLITLERRKGTLTFRAIRDTKSGAICAARYVHREAPIDRNDNVRIDTILLRSPTLTLSQHIFMRSIPKERANTGPLRPCLRQLGLGSGDSKKTIIDLV
jgi:hypothetical protein